jgi:hypothetical protein
MAIDFGDRDLTGITIMDQDGIVDFWKWSPNAEEHATKVMRALGMERDSLVRDPITYSKSLVQLRKDYTKYRQKAKKRARIYLIGRTAKSRKRKAMLQRQKRSPSFAYIGTATGRITSHTILPWEVPKCRE